MDTDKSSPMTPLLIKGRGGIEMLRIIHLHPSVTRRQRSKMHPWSGFAEYLCFGCFEILIASEKAGNDLGPSVAIWWSNFWIGACARFMRERMMRGCIGLMGAGSEWLEREGRD